MANWLRSTWAQWALAVLLFSAASLFYMGPAITSCSTTTTAFNSDSSGGLAWFQWAGGNDLHWGFTDKSNFPAGEVIDRPQFISSQAFFIPYKILSALTAPICGLNLMLLLGYMATALLMFGLIRWLFKRTAIALFAGYAAAFVPFHQFKAQSHIVYASGAVFIAVLWAYLWFMQAPSYKRASLLAAAGAVGFYTDGYFVLFTAVTLGSLIFFGYLQKLFTVSWREGSKKAISQWLVYLKSHLRYLAWFVTLLAILLLPILYTYKYHSSEISGSLSAARSPIRIELKNYAARPVEFFVPQYNNPLMPDNYAPWRLNQQHNSNPTEDTLFLGYTVLALALVAIIASFTKKTRKIMLAEDISYRGLAVILGATVLTLFLFSLPYKYTFARILIKLTENWRVLSRFFLAIDPLVIILAAAGMFVLVRKWPRYIYLSFVGLCAVVLFLEYLTSPLRPHGDLYKDTPAIYQTLAKDDSVQEIAEYPLIALGSAPSTFTYAQVHGKKLVNANNSSLGRDAFHSAVAGLKDSQTLGVLKSIGVNVVTTLSLGNIAVAGLVEYAPNQEGPVRAYTIAENVQARGAVLLPNSGFFDLSVDNNQISHRSLRKDGTMEVRDTQTNKNATGRYRVVFNIEGQPGVAHLIVSQNGQVLWDGSLEQGRVEFSALGEAPITLGTTVAVDITNMEAVKE